MLRKIVFLLCATSAVFAIPRKLSIDLHNYFMSSRIILTQVQHLNAQTLRYFFGFHFVIERWKFNLPLGYIRRYFIEFRMGIGNRV